MHYSVLQISFSYVYRIKILYMCITSGVYVPDICDENNMSCLFDVTIPFAVCKTLVKWYVNVDKIFGNSFLFLGSKKAREQGLGHWLSHMLQIYRRGFSQSGCSRLHHS